MDYKAFIGRVYPAFTARVEAERLRRFAAAIGETDPVFVDETAALAAGYPALPAPPTFSFCLALEAGQSFNILADMGVPITKAVHGAQGFDYKKPLCAGDRVTGVQTVTDIFEKKGGALIFIDAVIAMVNQHGDAVCDLHSTIVVRNT